MFGSKLRSWMEAVRPRKKQQRKEKQKSNNMSNGKFVTALIPSKAYSSENEPLEDAEYKANKTISNHAPRYSGTNLSSPESAYSTGYSTDGTSPGAPPEYYINIRTGTKYFPSSTNDKDSISKNANSNISACFKENADPLNAKMSPRLNKSGVVVDHMSTVAVKINDNATAVSMREDYKSHPPVRASVTFQNNSSPMNGLSSRVTEVVTNSGITSPRQRNRIRTNPWLPGNNLSPCASNIGLYVKQENLKQTIPNSPMAIHCTSLCSSPAKKLISRRESTSSSCSSLSAASLHWDANLVNHDSGSEEDDDCTLNEMMGKYDESYIYEKETDILSDSDPTDCETDIDTGQDGGDEEEPLEHEFDFIDNGSYLEFNIKDDRNTGHCTYYNFDVQRKSSRRRTSRKFKQDNPQLKQTRRKSTSSKQRPVKQQQQTHLLMQHDGSKSAGATPMSVRRVKYPISKLALEDLLKKRSNSVSFGRDTVNTFDQRDKEADRKYKELIVEAEHILMSMKHGGLSPRRLPGPANKRVELLRTESTKPDLFNKNRLIDDISNMHLSKIPSNFTNSRYSPKRNHITNFINNNSPVHIRREARDVDRQIDLRNSGLFMRKDENIHGSTVVPNSPVMKKKYHTKGEARRSPKYRKKVSKTISFRNHELSSSDSENDRKSKRLPMRNSDQNGFACPQSEPVKRKVYNHQSEAVGFNLDYESIYNTEHPNSVENLRQQVILNTIANLKKSLEDQSASLKQVYTSSQNVQI
ncbi:hypothetical protein AMK59_5969 [Oryctes borbonicus]|uniref:Uncharacterized protein n=1 Tax=Oryctes borbonicus TaxID=1629725 RepID=A0A0T6B1N4_9SCAR|nr:hypothetical protein AMK59_5969 [Oryctes borbonicus]